MKYYQKALKITQKTGSRLVYGLTLYSFGLLYNDLKDFDKAENYLNIATTIDSSNCITLRNWAHLNYKINNKETSCKYVNKAKQFCTFHKSVELLQKIEEKVCH